VLEVGDDRLRRALCDSRRISQVTYPKLRGLRNEQEDAAVVRQQRPVTFFVASHVPMVPHGARDARHQFSPWAFV
jgi:hypothetical protein